MTHRSDRVYLPDTDPRCEPAAKWCDHKATCARYLAAIPPMGTLTDFSGSMLHVGADCAYFARVGVRPAPVKPKEVKPWPSA